MDEYIELVYILIASGSKPLAGYCLYEGEWVSTCENELKKCKKKTGSITCKKLKLYYLNNNNIKFVIMTSLSYPAKGATSCLENLQDEFGNELYKRNFTKIKNYGLNGELRERLRKKFHYYNDNYDNFEENQNGKKKNDEKISLDYNIMDAIDSLHQRGDALNQMMGKVSNLEEASKNYLKKCENYRKRVEGKEEKFDENKDGALFESKGNKKVIIMKDYMDNIDDPADNEVYNLDVNESFEMRPYQRKCICVIF